MVASNPPRTWADGEVVSGARLNSELRDQLRQSALHIVSSRGQMVYAVGVRELATLDPPSAASALYHPGGNVPPEWRAATAANFIEAGGLTAAKMGARQAAQAIAAGELTNAQLAAGAAIANIGPGGIGTTELADNAGNARTLDDAAVRGKLAGTNRLPPDAFNAVLRTRLGLNPAPFFDLTAARTGILSIADGVSVRTTFPANRWVFATTLITGQTQWATLPFESIRARTGTGWSTSSVQTTSLTVGGRDTLGAYRLDGPNIEIAATLNGGGAFTVNVGQTVWVHKAGGWAIWAARTTSVFGQNLPAAGAQSFDLTAIDAIPLQLFPINYPVATSPNGTRYRLTVSDAGVLGSEAA